jgi:hypothetical protein
MPTGWHPFHPLDTSAPSYPSHLATSAGHQFQASVSYHTAALVSTVFLVGTLLASSLFMWPGTCLIKLRRRSHRAAESGPGPNVTSLTTAVLLSGHFEGVGSWQLS